MMCLGCATLATSSFIFLDQPVVSLCLSVCMGANLHAFSSCNASIQLARTT